MKSATLREKKYFGTKVERLVMATEYCLRLTVKMVFVCTVSSEQVGRGG